MMEGLRMGCYLMRRRFFCLFVLMVFAGVCLSDGAWAQRYTTNQSRTSSKAETGERCSRSQLQQVQRFDRTARANIERYKKLSNPEPGQRSRDVRGQRDVEKIVQEVQEISAFFQSDEYKDMEVLYKQCNLKIPKPASSSLFWAPYRPGRN